MVTVSREFSVLRADTEQLRADDIDLAAIWRLIGEYKRWIACVTIGFTVAALIASLLMTPIFRAQVTVTPANNPAMGGSEGLGSQLSGLASLAGVDLPFGQGMQRQAAAVLKSDHLIEEFIRRYDLLPIVLAKSSHPKSLWWATKTFKEGILHITEDMRSSTTAVAIDYKDPRIAALWANNFVALANELMRRHALEQSTRNIEYLKDQVAKTDDVDLRRGLYDLIENETKTQMIAEGQAEFAFTVVDPATVPGLKARPHRSIVTLIGMAAGFILAVLIAYLHRAYVRARRARVANA